MSNKLLKRHAPNVLMASDDVRELQRSLNTFTDKYLRTMSTIQVDGVTGPATERRVMTVKYYLGYGKHRDGEVTSEFVRRMRHPRSKQYSPESMLATGAKRRKEQREQSLRDDKPKDGVGHFDGRPAAAWLIPYLQWAREHGWTGTLNSGWRDPLYSESLCRRMCGAPSCPGKCAGKSSNHSGSASPVGAIDVSDYGTFGELMKKCPLEPRILNALGAQDPVHYSVSGR